MPWCSASPERGLICPSVPGGSAIPRPVGMAARLPGAMMTGAPAGTAAMRSSPAACTVRSGAGKSTACGRSSIRTFTFSLGSPQNGGLGAALANGAVVLVNCCISEFDFDAPAALADFHARYEWNPSALLPLSNANAVNDDENRFWFFQAPQEFEAECRSLAGLGEAFPK